MKKTVLLRVFFFIIVLVLLFFCKKNMYDHYNNYYKKNKYKKIKSDKINPDEPINEIFKNINIIQKLNIEDTKRFSGLGILFATYARETNEEIDYLLHLLHLSFSQKVYFFYFHQKQ